MSTEVKLMDSAVELSRVFAAPRERVFEAWTNATHLEKWWGCAQTTNVKAELDVQEGGKLTILMTIEGVGEMPYTGVYTEVKSPERLAFSVDLPTPDGGVQKSSITIDFLEEGEGTRLVMRQDGFAMPELREIVSGGWSAALEKLENSLAA